MPIENYHPREQDLDIMAHLGEWDCMELKRSLWEGTFTPYNEDFSTLWRWWFLMPNTTARNAFNVGEYVAQGYIDLATTSLHYLKEEIKCQFPLATTPKPNS